MMIDECNFTFIFLAIEEKKLLKPFAISLLSSIRLPSILKLRRVLNVDVRFRFRVQVYHLT